MKKIVIVDDDVRILNVLKAMLEEEHFSVTVVNDPSKVRATLSEKNKPDIVFIDASLGTQNGVDLCNELKSDNSTNSIPLILMTAGIHIEDKAKRAHADGYLKKPFGFDELLETTSKFIKN